MTERLSVPGPAEVSAPPALLALDIDGTILDHDQVLTERVRAAIKALAARDVHVVVATGRAVHDTVPVLRELGLTSGWTVCSNGAVTVRLDSSVPRGYEVADVVTFDAGSALRLLREHLPGAVYAVEDQVGDYLLTGAFPPGELEGTHVRVVDFETLLTTPACRVVVRSPEHTSEDFQRLTRAIGLHGVNYAVGWTAWLDLAPKGVSKASALDGVCARLSVSPADVAAFGDGRNDIEMFEWAGRAYAMGNAVPEAKAAADEVIGDVKDDGLAQALEALMGGSESPCDAH